MKKYIYILILLLTVSVSFGYTADQYVRDLTYFGAGNKRLDPMYLHMTDAANGFGNRGTGSTFYVDSGVANEGDGTSWDRAKDTVEEAIQLCVAGRGDVIKVAQLSAESGTAAGLFDADIAGITIEGIGYGAAAPTFTFADTDTTIVAGAANVTFINLRFLAGISEVVVGVSVEAAATGFTMIGCDFPEPLTSTFEFNIAVQLTTGSNDATFIGNTAYSSDAVGADHWLNGGAGAVNRLTLIDNKIYGEYAIAPIFSDQVDLVCCLVGNMVTNATAGQFAIEFSANATGTYGDNWVFSSSEATSIDPGLLLAIAPNWAITASDASPVMWPKQDDMSTNFIGVDNSDNAAATTNVAANSDGSIFERLEQLEQYLNATDTKAGKTYATSMTATSTGDDLFDVDGGAVLITSFVGVVTTNIGAVGNIITIELDADAGFVDYDFSTAVETNADAAGTRYSFTDVALSVLTPMEGATGGGSILMGGGWFCGEGMIEQTSTGATTGVIDWYITWKPYADGTTVTAQ